MMSERCPVCQNSIEEQQLVGVGGGRVEQYKCENCGTFSMAEEARFELNVEQKRKLSAILRKRTIRGMGKIMIFLNRSDKNLSEFPYPIYLLGDLLSEYPDSASDRLDESLINLAKLSKFPGDPVYIRESDKSLFFVQSAQLLEMKYIANQLFQDELIEISKLSAADFPAHITVTAKGWNRIAELEKGREADTKQVFVAMSFSPKMDSPYKNAITKAIKEAGYQPIRIDEAEHNNDITDEIIVKIRQSKFVIADFTGHRAGVYFEAGYAVGLGKTVIWTCKDDDFKDIHFDTRQFSHIKWSTENELYQKLLNRIKATIN
ncbi:nucleoside 2-deoxyribosyltransferase [Bacillus sp. RC55]